MKLWIASHWDDRAELESLGVDMAEAWYHEAAEEWRDCEADDAALAALDPHWGWFIWGPQG